MKLARTSKRFEFIQLLCSLHIKHQSQKVFIYEIQIIKQIKRISTHQQWRKSFHYRKSYDFCKLFALLKNSSNDQLLAKFHLFIYLFIHLFHLFIFSTSARSLWKIFSISICVSMFIRENKFLNTRKNDKRAKNNKNNCSIFALDIFFTFFSFFFLFFISTIEIICSKNECFNQQTIFYRT